MFGALLASFLLLFLVALLVESVFLCIEGFVFVLLALQEMLVRVHLTHALALLFHRGDQLLPRVQAVLVLFAVLARARDETRRYVMEVDGGTALIASLSPLSWTTDEKLFRVLWTDAQGSCPFLQC